MHYYYVMEHFSEWNGYKNYLIVTLILKNVVNAVKPYFSAWLENEQIITHDNLPSNHC